MATIDRYKIVLDVEGQQAVKTLTGSIAGLGTAIAGIGFGAFIGNALRAADAMVDLGRATGFTAGEVKALGNSLQQAGGNAADIDKLLVGFYNTLEQAAAGSDKAVESLQKLGITQQDLVRLNEGQLFEKAITQLSQMDAGARSSAIGIDVFGKAMKGVNAKDFVESLKTQPINAYNAELQEAARVVQLIEQSHKNLQQAAVNVISQLTGGTKDYVISVESAEKAIKALGIAIGIAVGASTLASIIRIALAFGTLTKAILGTAAAANFLSKSGLAILARHPALKVLIGLAAATGLAGDSASDYQKELEGLNKEFDKLNAAGQQAGAAMPAPGGPIGLGAGRGPAFADTRATAEQRAAAAAAEAARQTTQQLKEQNKEALIYQQIVNDTIGMESNRASLISANAQLEQDANNKLLDLQKQIALERAKEKPNPVVLDELYKQSELVIKQKDAQTKLNEERYKALELVRATSMELERGALTKTRQIELDLLKQQIEGMNAITLQEQTAMKMAQITAEEKKKIVELQKELAAAQLAGDQTAIRDIQERIRLEGEYYNTVRNLENQRMTQELANRENRMLGIQRSLEQVARQYDPVRVAADQTTLLFDRMGSALEEFVKTGKMNFKDFALSLIRDMLMIQVKAQAMSFMREMFSGSIGGGGILGSLLGGLFGLANGGPAKANTPYIVGEKGPELFVPKSAGTVIPNGQTAAMNGNGRSMGVSAPVTNNYITNNISAVDAKSVAKLFLENRKTLLGSVNMARKEMPYGV